MFTFVYVKKPKDFNLLLETTNDLLFGKPGRVKGNLAIVLTFKCIHNALVVQLFCLCKTLDPTNLTVELDKQDYLGMA